MPNALQNGALAFDGVTVGMSVLPDIVVRPLGRRQYLLDA
jgi:hypothetical protein